MLAFVHQSHPTRVAFGRDIVACREGDAARFQRLNGDRDAA
jgi:hypothetical protein